MMEPAMADARRGEGRVWLGVVCLLLVGAYLMVRLPRLREMPVFCDEGAYLHWAQMIRMEPGRNLWISMEDAKPPLHYWLLALVYGVDSDPIWAGRMLSVVCGALLIPVLFLLGGELRRLARTGVQEAVAGVFGPVASAFMIASPVVAFYQRMALAESLLLLESVVMVWLSLGLARRIAAGEGWGGVYRQAAWVGLAWAASLLTKQNFSYVLMAIPVMAVAMHGARGDVRGLLKRAAGPMGVVAGIGAACFVPVLFTSATQPWMVRLFYKAAANTGDLKFGQIVMFNGMSLLLPRVEGRWAWWPHDAGRLLQEGMLYVYLTPVGCVLLAVGCWRLARRGSLRLFGLFGGWAMVLLGPLVVSGNLLKTRYALLGIFPLLLLAAWAAGEVYVRVRGLGVVRGRMGMAAVAVLLAWPLAATMAQTMNRDAATCLQGDRDEYLSDLSGGAAWQEAVAWFRREAESRKITIVTGPRFNLGDDYLWLSLAGNPNIQMLCTNSLPLVRLEGGGDRYLLSGDPWRPGEARAVEIPADRPVYTVGIAIFDPASGSVQVNQRPESLAAEAHIVGYFRNPPLLPWQKPVTGITLLGVHDRRGLAAAQEKQTLW